MMKPFCYLLPLVAASCAWSAEPAPPLRKPDVKAEDPDAKYLSDLKVPEGFEATIFAHPPMVNYPIFLSAAPDGTLFVGSDPNGSLDRETHRGRILRLRDTKGTGHADEVTEFVKDVDSPRGVLWDHDRLYVLHPPDISVYIDSQKTGTASETKTVVKGIGWTFKDRPADHASNGLAMGIDGWIYCAIGDFGFMKAEGTDGRTERFRGGGIVRVRPDGTGLEIYARGTRNILEPAISPLLDLFARDNTNDGDGWDTRLHHFTGLENHGYPTLFKHFPDETVAQLADYGGGSATGSVWLDEPGIPKVWNNTALTCDWGRSLIYSHRLVQNGATFTTDQKEFFGATRVNDIDVDAQSHLYISSWKGATFKFAGPDVGYLVRLSPQGYQAPKLPDFDHLSVAELAKLLESPSAKIRLEAQRTIIRGNDAAAATPLLQGLASDGTKSLATRVAALFGLKQMLGAKTHEYLAKLAGDPTIAAWAIRALTDREDQLAGVPLEPILTGLKSADPRTRKEAAVAIARLGAEKNATALLPLLDDADAIVGHTVVTALQRLHALDAALTVIDKPDASSQARARALQVVQLEHTPAAVDAVLARLEKTRPEEQRRGLLTALCRLYFVEGEWQGNSWGTRPDTRGPYYQPETWIESKRIDDALMAVLNNGTPDEVKFLSGEFARHRVNPGDATGKLLELAAKDASIVPVLAAQYADLNEAAPMKAAPFLIALAEDKNAKANDRLAAATSLAKIDSPEAVRACLEVLAATRGQDSSKEVQKARSTLFNAPKIENHHALLEKTAAKMDGPVAMFADAALVKLAGRRFGAPEPREQARQALQEGVTQPKRALQIVEAMRVAEDSTQAKLILPLLQSPDAALVKATNETLKKLKIDPATLTKPTVDSAPLIATLKLENVVNDVAKTHGDVQRGEQLFAQQGCVACHTTKPSEPLKGPYLGTIATVYQRKELAENILNPNKSIAQGFATNHFELNDGAVVDGFVTEEAAAKVSIRTITSQEMTFETKNIKARSVQEKSMMPEHLVDNLSVKDFASLVDYLEALSKK